MQADSVLWAREADLHRRFDVQGVDAELRPQLVAHKLPRLQIAFIFLGDGLNDALNPRHRRR